jgi:hypothetical protein
MINQVQIKFELPTCEMKYLTLGLVSSLNNPSNFEMAFCENMMLELRTWEEC